MTNNKTTFRWCVAAVAILCLAIWAVGVCISCQRYMLLRAAPKGSSMEQVLALCQKRGFRCQRSDTAGFLNQDTGQAVGVRSVWATIKTGRSLMLPFVSSTAAYWGFDQEGRLLDVWVWRTIDAP
jgi:hypothetical protein